MTHRREAGPAPPSCKQCLPGRRSRYCWDARVIPRHTTSYHNGLTTTAIHIMTTLPPVPHLSETGRRWSSFTISPGPIRRASTTSQWQSPTRSKTVEFPITGKGTVDDSVITGSVSSSHGCVERSPRARNASQSSMNARRRGGDWADLWPARGSKQVKGREAHVGVFRQVRGEKPRKVKAAKLQRWHMPVTQQCHRYHMASRKSWNGGRPGHFSP